MGGIRRSCPDPPRRARRGHFPNERAALTCAYLAVMALDHTGQGRKRWTTRWKALNAFEITFAGRLSADRKNPHQDPVTPST